MTGWTIKFIPGMEVVEVRYAGEVSYALRIDTLCELERVLAAAPLRRLLVNYTSAWPTPVPEPADVARFAAKLAHVSFARGARVALVNAPSDVDAPTSAASAPVWFLFRQFDDRTLAIDWLLASTEESPIDASTAMPASEMAGAAVPRRRRRSDGGVPGAHRLR